MPAAGPSDAINQQKRTVCENFPYWNLQCCEAAASTGLTFEIPSVPATSIGTCALAAGPSILIAATGFHHLVLSTKSPTAPPKQSPLSRISCCWWNNRASISLPCPRLGLIQLPAECKPITARALLYMGLIGPCMYARYGKKRWATRAPSMLFESFTCL